MVFCGTYCAFVFHVKLFSPGHGSFLALSTRGTQEGCAYTAVQVWASAGLRGACSGRSKSLELLFFTGLRSATPSRPGPWDHGSRTKSAFGTAAAITPSLQLSSSLQYSVAGTVQQQSHVKIFPLRRYRTMLLCVRVWHVSCRPT